MAYEDSVEKADENEIFAIDTSVNSILLEDKTQSKRFN